MIPFHPLTQETPIPMRSYTALTRCLFLCAMLLALSACSGKNSLHKAANQGDLEKVKALVAEGAPIDAVDGLGSTPLNLAARSGHPEVVKFLIENGANVNHRDQTGNTILHTATQMVRPEIAVMLIDNGAEVDEVETIWKRTALHYVAQLGPPEVAQYLIDHGANVNARDSYGDTPLHYAALSDHVRIAHMLLDKGADPHVPGLDPFTRAPGTTPLMLAHKKGMQDLFKQFGAE